MTEETDSSELADERLGEEEEEEEFKPEMADPAPAFAGDEISKLLDELLAIVVSRLSLKEAIDTSLLSRRWKDLWKHAGLALDLNDREIDDELQEGQFKSLVDGAVNLLQRQHNMSLRKFRIDVSYDRNSRDIGRWLEFAISKRVESLHLEFCCNPHSIFPEHCYSHMKTPAGLSGIKSLRSLRLNRVNLRDEVLEHIVANCPLLEELALKQSMLLHRLKFVGTPHSPLSLKLLEVGEGKYKSLEIDHAPCLTRVVCSSQLTTLLEELRIDNCPNLAEMELGTPCHFYCNPKLGPLSGGAGHLESLSILIDFFHIPVQVVEEHTRLERLTVQVIGHESESILGLVPLINLCPRLHTLQLRFVHWPDLMPFGRPLEAGAVEKTRRESIKVVEILFFDVSEMQQEFIKYAMEYFVGLERMVIRRHFAPGEGELRYGDGIECKNYMSRAYRDRMLKSYEVALKLKAEAPPGIEVILR